LEKYSKEKKALAEAEDYFSTADLSMQVEIKSGTIIYLKKFINSHIYFCKYAFLERPKKVNMRDAYNHLERLYKLYKWHKQEYGTK
jgi:hypothetical protein